MPERSKDEEIAYLRQRLAELETVATENVQLKQQIAEYQQRETALKTALENLEYQFYLCKMIIDKTLDWIFIKDTNYRYLFVNHTTANSLGKTPEEMIGKDDVELGTPTEIVFGNPEKNIRGFRTDDIIVLGGESIHNPYDPVPGSDGKMYILDTQKLPLRNSDGEIFAMLGVSRDITDRHHAEEELRRSENELRQRTLELEKTLKQLKLTQSQLIHSEKMSSLGQLVGGIAHEINNPINFIYGNLNHAYKYIFHLLKLIQIYEKNSPYLHQEILEYQTEIDMEFIQEDLPNVLISIRNGTERIKQIVDSLRIFSHLDQAEFKCINIHHGIDSALMLLQNRLNQKIPIKVIRKYSQLPLIECYPGELNQALMNILLNAIDALEGIGIKRSKNDYLPIIKSQNTSQTNSQISPEICISTILTKSSHAIICIANNGPVITQEIRRKIFDPFYSTKPIGKGTGLGLSISYQIITNQHQGSFKCISHDKIGTAFVIKIPISQPKRYRIV